MKCSFSNPYFFYITLFYIELFAPPKDRKSIRPDFWVSYWSSNARDSSSDERRWI